MRYLFIVLIFLFPLSSIVATQASDPIWLQHNDNELRLLQLHINKEPYDDIIAAYQVKDTLILPLGFLSQILELAISTNPANGIAKGFILKEHRQFYLDTSRSEVTLSGKTHKYDKELVSIYSDDIYVEINQLAKWIPVNIDINLFSSIINIQTKEPFPFQLRKEREKRIALKRNFYLPQDRNFKRQKINYELFSIPFVDQTFALNARDSQTSDTDTSFNYTTHAAADLFYMESSLYLNGNSEQGLQDYRFTLGRKDPDAGLLGLFNAREFSFGHSSLPGANLITSATQAKLGVEVSNFPLTQQNNFDSHTFEGELLPGWEIELYHNNILLDHRSSPVKGQYRFEDVPLLFGKNYFRLVFYGPHGEEREQTHNFILSNSLTRPGQQYYRFNSIKDDNSDEILSRFQYDVGLSKFLSMNFNYISSPLKNKIHHYSTIGISGFWDSLLMDLNYIEDSEVGSAQDLGLQTGFENFNLKFNHTEFDNFSSPIFQSSDLIIRRSKVRLDTAIPKSFLPRIAVTLEYNTEKFKSGKIRQEWFNRLSFNNRGIAVSHDLRIKETSQQAVNQTGSLQVSYHRHGYSLRGSINYKLKPTSDLTSVSLNYQLKNFADYRLSLGANHNPNSNDQYTVGLNKRHGKYSLTMSTSYTTNGNLSFNLTASMGFGRDPASREWRQTAKNMAGMGAVSASAFLDDNQNGIRDTGENGLSDVAFEFNGSKRSYRTDKSGRVFITQITAYQPLDINISLSSLDDPLWLPATKGLKIVPRPGQVAAIQFPVITTGEIDGTVYIQRQGEARYASNIKLELLDESAKVILTEKSSFDGFYILSQIPLGKYLLRISPEQIKQMGLIQPPAKTVIITNKNLFINGADIVLTPKR